MIAIAKEDQIKELARLLKPLGFKKRRATWHRELADTIHVINVQGSQWGPAYYLNVGTYLRALGDELTPPEYHCHIRERIHHPDRPASVLVRECLDWFADFGTVSSLVMRSKSKSLPLFTNGAAKEWLNRAAIDL